MNSKMEYFERIENSEQESFLRFHNHCILCGDSLDLRHIKDQGEDTITEEAFCWNCEIRARERTHPVN